MKLAYRYVLIARVIVLTLTAFILTLLSYWKLP